MQLCSTCLLQGFMPTLLKLQMHYLANAKKCSCPEGGLGKCTIWLMSQGFSTFYLKGGEWGVISQNAMQVAYISIMNCSLPVISLLTCCQKRSSEGLDITGELYIDLSYTECKSESICESIQISALLDTNYTEKIE